MSEEDTRPPLGIPPGSVRAIIAISIVLGAFILLAIDEIDFEQLMALVALPVGFYFGQYVSK